MQAGRVPSNATRPWVLVHTYAFFFRPVSRLLSRRAATSALEWLKLHTIFARQAQHKSHVNSATPMRIIEAISII